MSIDSTTEQASLTQLQQTPIDNILQVLDDGLVHLPTYRELYNRWERQHWKASEIDFSVDRQQWLAMSQYERTVHIYTLAGFFQGEVSVADALSPYIIAMPNEEMRLYVMTQQVDEARHTVFFSRFFSEVIGIDRGSIEDTMIEVRQYMNEHQRYILVKSLAEIRQRLLHDPADLTTLIEGVVLYHVITEGTIGLTGLRTILENYRLSNIFPAFRGGFAAVARDESRHVAFGVKFLRDMIQHDHMYARIVQTTINKYGPIALQAVTPLKAQVQGIQARGQDPMSIRRFALDSLRKKLKVIGLSMDLPEMSSL